MAAFSVRSVESTAAIADRLRSSRQFHRRRKGGYDGYRLRVVGVLPYRVGNNSIVVQRGSAT